VCIAGSGCCHLFAAPPMHISGSEIYVAMAAGGTTRFALSWDLRVSFIEKEVLFVTNIKEENFLYT
jgi:hypothetical protein